VFIRRRALPLGVFVFGETTVNAARIFPQRPRIRRRSARPGLRRRVALVMSVSLVMLGGALVVPVLAPAAGAVTPNAAPAAGARKSATRLGFTVSGTAGLSVDVATGNAEFTDQLVTLPGVNSDVSVALAWNSSVVGTSLPSAVTGGTGSGWVITGFDQRLIVNADNSITYYGPGGLSGVFAQSGSAYTSPSQFQGTLATKSGGGWTLTMHGSQNVLTFTAAGRLATAADRNGNLTTFNYDPYGNPASIRPHERPRVRV